MPRFLTVGLVLLTLLCPILATDLSAQAPVETPTTAPAWDAEGLSTDERAAILLHDTAFHFSFDVNKTALQLATLLAEDPSSVLVAEVFRRRREVFDRCDDRDLFLKTMSSVTDGFEDFGPLGDFTMLYLNPIINELMQTGNIRQAHDLRRSTLGLQKWSVLGPFGRSNDGDFYFDTLAPDLLLDTAVTYRGAFGEVSWEDWISEDPLDDAVGHPQGDRPRGNGYYYLSAFTSEKAQVARIAVSDTRSGVKLFLNGHVIYEQVPGQHRGPTLVDAELEEGRNVLVVRVGASAQLRIRVTDPETGLSLPLAAASSADVRLSLNAGAYTDRTEVIDPLAFTLKELSENDRYRENTFPTGTNADVTLAFIYQSLGRVEESENAWKAAAEWLEAQPSHVRHTLTAVYMDGNVLATAAQVRNLRRIALEGLAARNEDGTFNPNALGAAMQLARITGEEGRETTAAEMFDAVLAQSSPWFARLDYASFFTSKKWDAQARNQRLLAYETTTEKPVTLLLDRAQLAIGDRQRDFAIELLEKIVFGGRKYHASALRMLKDAYLDAAKFGDVRHVLEAFEEMAGYRSESLQRELAELELAQGNGSAYVEGFKQLATRTKVSSTAARYLTMAANVELMNGGTDAAKVLLLEALARDPSSEEARKLVVQLDGNTHGSSHPLWTTVDHALLNTILADDYPLASAAYLLDEEVWEVQADGSYQSWSQKVLKILRQAGVDRFGRQSLSGEVLTVRTMLANGGESEPATVVGTNFEFPLVAPGNALHWSTRSWRRGGEEKTLAGNSFSFASSDIAIPTALARLVVLAPEGMTLAWEGRNLSTVEYTKTSLEDGRTRHVWAVRNPRSRLREQNMPGNEEWLPVLTFGGPERDSQAAERRNLAANYSSMTPTWLMRQTLEAILKEQEEESGGVATADEIYRWVNQNIPTSGGNRHPHLTILEKSGDREALFVELCILAGFAPERVQVSTLKTPVATPESLARRSFRQTLWSVEGRLYSLADRQTPAGEVPMNLMGQPAWIFDTALGYQSEIVVGGKVGALHNHTQLSFSVTEDFSAEVGGSLAGFDVAAWQAKERARLTSQSQRERDLTGELSALLPSLKDLTFDVVGLEEVGQPWLRTFEGKVGKEGVTPRAGHLLPHVPRVSDMLLPLVDLDERQFDLIFTTDYRETVNVYYELPELVKVREVPADYRIETPVGSVSVTYLTYEGTIEVSKTFELRSARIPAAQYHEFRKQVQLLAQHEDKTIRLTSED